ncbi:prepilin-type N-terminal cleavage/methylation domain-containing protein [Paenibacillus mucilaginosus]|uniref:type IV pilus modification PilV family protein n=1 Tax=Paenibacillus mucilaginosus TaxID=61624 RepID=UPI003D24511A
MLKRIRGREEGFTLIEVLAASVILAIAGLTMTAFFINAMSYNKANQNKTVMVNLARNALFYMEKRSFKEMEKYLVTYEMNISTEECGDDPRCSGKSMNALLIDTDRFPGLWDVLNPSVNGIEYTITVSHHKENKVEGGGLDTTSFTKHLLPVMVEVRAKSDDAPTKYRSTEVRGYITDESIRKAD